MEYREVRPGPALAAHVECFWQLEGPASPDTPPSRILPDGCTEIVLNFADPFERHHTDGIERQPLVLMVGQMTSQIRIRPTGRVDLLGIRFRPHGARPFLAVPARELAGRLDPLLDCDCSLERELEDEIGDAPAAKRIARAERCLLRRLLRSRHAAGDPAVATAVQRILAWHGRVDIAALATSLGLSARSLERRFDAWVGLTPQMLARITRFQRVFSVYEAGGGWARTAARCGYYDQSHLLRDFRQFAGESPAALLAEAVPLTYVFTRANRRPDS